MNSIIKVLENTSFYDGVEEGKNLSASAITQGVLPLWFKTNGYDKQEKLSDATLGSIVHLGMEKILTDALTEGDEPYIIEQRFSKQFSGWNINGKPDLIVGDTIWDYKTGKNYSRKQFLKEGKLHPYSIQMSVYAWLTGSTKAKILWMMKDSKAIDGEPVFIEDDVVLMSSDEVENLIFDKIEELEKYDKDTMPPECTDLWLRKHKGTVIKMKCQLYCGYKNSCPYFKPTERQTVSAW